MEVDFLMGRATKLFEMLKQSHAVDRRLQALAEAVLIQKKYLHTLMFPLTNACSGQ
jgi:hypothetical protein